MKIKEKTYAIFLLFKKEISVFLNKFFVNVFEKNIFFLLINLDSKTSLVINIAQNKEVKIPIIKVVAKPLIGPFQNKKELRL